MAGGRPAGSPGEAAHRVEVETVDSRQCGGLVSRMPDVPQSSRLQEAQRAARRIMAEGVFWLVYELPPSHLDRRQSPSLVFESETTVRRVRDYPANWRALGDEELLALSWSI